MWALLPLKDFVQAKQRLSGSLTVSERRGLFHAMVEDVLTVMAAYPGFERVVLVSDDPAAQLLAEHYGVDCWSERSFAVQGLNAVVTAAVAKIHSLTTPAPTAVMVVHGDLPLLSASELDIVIKQHSELLGATQTGLSIVTDRHQRGSNILVCDPAQPLQLAYGQDSCAQHLAEARRIGIPAQVLHLPNIAEDIDTRADLLRLLALPEAPMVANTPETPVLAAKTLTFLREAGIAQRLITMRSEANAEALRVHAESAVAEWNTL
ncbi:2-phospho-L-lactate guanylyltransferase [Zhongshania sp.]|uniref:2-phospho-L-lactate guanylyltransferase n=1 Tax=Zhongshania sp. TaxID=1971902 RepID=UPI00356408D1